MRFLVFFLIVPLGSLALAKIDAKTDLSTKQARRLITRIAGFELPNSAVRIKRISATDDSSTTATAEVQTAFRLMKNEQGRWRVAEVRTGPNRWEGLEFLPGYGNTEEVAIGCDGLDLVSRSQTATDPSAKRARCLIAALLAIQLPSDAVRIKSVSPGLGPASHPSALVEALVTLEVRFAQDGRSGWLVTGVRTWSRDWINPETLVVTANEEKKKRALAELGTIATALDKFRAERHFYVTSESHEVLIDHLSPRYLPRVIRVDPWQESYRYHGARDSYTLRSMGPDRKENTGDDIVVSSPVRRSSGESPSN